MNAYFISWDPDAQPENLKSFASAMKGILRKQQDDVSLNLWDLPPSCDASQGDILFVVRTDANCLAQGVAMVAILFEPGEVDGVKQLPRSCIQPIYTFDTDRYDVLKPAAWAHILPDVDWQHFNGFYKVPEEAFEKVINLWMDYILAHYDTMSHRGGTIPRKPKASTFFDNPSIIAFAPGIYPYVYKRFQHKCDICGIDFDYVYGRLDNVPTAHFVATVRKSFSKGVPDYRSVSCICGNCWPLIVNGSTIDELRSKVRAVTCDPSTTIAMQVRLTPGRILS